jgi:hypothetical protein
VATPRENGALSARTVLEVADGLRWTDPGLGASLAEHALRLAGEDAGVRTAAERSVIRSLAEVDRLDEVVSRAAPLLDEATAREDRDDVAGLLVELAATAVGLGDDAVAASILAPVGPGEVLPAHVTALAALVRAQLAGARGDVAGTDQASAVSEAALGGVAEPEAGLVRRDLARARASARRRGGDPSSALPIVTAAVSADPRGDADGGRRSLLAAADEVDLLLDLGRPDDALARGRAVLPGHSSGPLVVDPTARIRLALADRVHAVRGAHAEAQSLARSAATELEAAGHDASAARAWQVVAGAAERAGDLGAALSSVRHAHELESRSRDRRDPALRVLTMIAAAPPDLPARSAPPSAPPAPPEPMSPPVTSTLSEMETLLADARSSVTSEANGTPLPRRRAHRRDDDDGIGDGYGSPLLGSETVPEAIARLLGQNGHIAPGAPEGEAAPPAPENGAANGTGAGLAPHDALNGTAAPDLPEPAALPGLADLAGLTGSSSGSTRRSRHSAEPDDAAGEPTPDGAPRPTFDAFSTAPMPRIDDAGPRADAPGTPAPPDDGSGAASVGTTTAGSSAVESGTPSRDRSVDDLMSWSSVDRFSSTGTDRGSGVVAAGTNGSAPNGAVSSGAVSNAAVSNGSVSNGSVSNGSAPPSRGVRDGGAGEGLPEIDLADPLGAGSSWGISADHGSGSASNGSAPGDRGVHPLDEALRSRSPGERARTSSDSSGPGQPERADDVAGRAEPGRPVPTSEQTSTQTSMRERDGSPAGRAGGLSPAGPPTPEAARTGSRSTEPRAEGPRPAARPVPAGFDPEDLDGELALTLVSLLAEYHLPDVPPSPSRDRAGPGDVAVPSARGHTSGSMAVPASDQRFAPRPADAPRRPGPSSANGTGPGRAGRGENGERLADLLAEAMDAFRHTGPGDGAREPGVGTRRA